MLTIATLFGLLSALAAGTLFAMSHRGHDEYGHSVESYAAFRAALARSDAPPRRP
jgi:hypothetical protein